MDKYVNQLSEVTSAGNNDAIPIQPEGVTGLRYIKKSNLVTGTSGSGTSIGLGERSFSTTLTSPAGQNEIRFDNLTTVTEVYLHEDDENGTDRSASINEITATSQLKVRLVSDPENFFKILKLVSQTDNTGSHTLVGTQLESKGDWSGLNGQAVSVNVDLKEDISGKADKTTIDQTFNFVNENIVLEYTQPQNYRITAITGDPGEVGLTISNKLSGTSTDYLGQNLSAWDKLDISVNMPAAIRIQGEII